MTRREQATHLTREARQLHASPLLWKMVHIIFDINGYEAALRCLREGVAQNIS